MHLLNRSSLKQIVEKNRLLNRWALALYSKFLIWKSLRSTDVNNAGLGKVIKDIIGKNNSIKIGRNSKVEALKIRIRGNNNKLSISERCKFGPECSIWLEGNNIVITIGEGSTFTTRCHLNAQEDETSIIIGEDCMFSNNIIVRTSDSHPIYDSTSKLRINLPENVVIGSHVWIAPNTKIMKGSIIPNGCIIGSDTTTNKVFEEPNSLIVGRPAKVIRSGIEWTREKLF